MPKRETSVNSLQVFPVCAKVFEILEMSLKMIKTSSSQVKRTLDGRGRGWNNSALAGHTGWHIDLLINAAQVCRRTADKFSKRHFLINVVKKRESVQSIDPPACIMIVSQYLSEAWQGSILANGLCVLCVCRVQSRCWTNLWIELFCTELSSICRCDQDDRK